MSATRAGRRLRNAAQRLEAARLADARHPSTSTEHELERAEAAYERAVETYLRAYVHLVTKDAPR